MQIIGHRGASGHAPENTLASFRLAFEMGCDGVEFDVQQSADGKLLVFHDWQLERCSNGTGLLHQKESSYLHSLDAGSWYDERFAAERIPSLSQVLDLMPAGKLINIEIKELHSASRGTAALLAKTVAASPRKNDIVVSSFSHNLLAELHKQDSSIKIGLLIDNTLLDLEAYIRSLSFPLYSYHPNISLLEAREIEAIKKLGLRIYPWTVNEAYQYQDCRHLGLDGIITNYPQRFR